MKKLIVLLMLSVTIILNAQESLNYQKPPKEILELVDVQPAPYVWIDDAKENIVLLYRDSYKTIEELSQKEMRLAGLRIDPINNIDLYFLTSSDFSEVVMGENTYLFCDWFHRGLVFGFFRLEQNQITY